MTSHLDASRSQASTQTRWQQLREYLVRRRVRITLIVFVGLMIEDVLIGIQPHDLTDVHDFKSMFAIALVASGLALRSWAAGILRKSRELATTGPYALMRNPLYVGSFLVMCGFCIVIDDYENIFVVLGPFVGLYLLQVLHEEQSLRELFGEKWDDYVRNVPRVLPRRLSNAWRGPWELRQWLGSREYRAMATVALGLVAVQAWHIAR
jgi:protein-S-isoprenylcysteine O-methyltransferase Ste14